MHFITLILFIVSSSLDNFIVGISYGVKKIHINLGNNLLIAAISGIGTLISILVGSIFSVCIPDELTKICGSILLLFLSIYLFYDYIKNKRNKVKNISDLANPNISNIDSYDEILHHPELADKDRSSNIEFKEALILGTALSLNNIGLGIGIGIIGISPYLASVFSAVFSLLFIQAGLIIGRKFFSNLLENYASIISILIILGLAIYNLLV